MPTNMYCPRGPGPDSPYKEPFDGSMDWDPANCCTYCGSLNPDEFMKRLEAGDARLGGSDKNYKVYVHNKGGEAFKQHYRECPKEAECTGPDDCTHWITRDMNQTKFYFQHLSEDQRKRFVELMNQKKVENTLYVLPFFISAK